MQDLRLSLIQTSLHWEDKKANLQMLEQQLQALNGKTDLVLLPEMFSTGFSMKAVQLAEEMNGSSVQWMQQQAARLGAVLCGSLIIRDREQQYNRLLWVQPDGQIHTYDKRHLFRMGEEHRHYSAGEQRLIVTYKGWNICPMVCYDLRFPVWCRNVKNEYDLLIFVANWPERRAQHWKALLKARAIENLAYVAGLNRVGTDGHGVYHSGDSTVLDARGQELFGHSHEEKIQTLTLSADELKQYRESFPAWQDADSFTLD